ncbi:MAG: hypothetical protein KDC10_12955 [Calditrichaeota bacterium]|nr:hypothetical protein [Candidatus Cloacimonadota bacterium]MCB1048099.1 hypothetical protein [Calditrichota bacterium]
MLPRFLLLLALGLPVAAGAQCDSGLLFHSYQIPGQLGQYAIHDAPGSISAPSNWTITSGGRLSQSSNIYTGSYPDWAGSMAWLDAECWQAFRLRVTVSPSDNDQWGLFFAADNPGEAIDGYRIAFSNELEAGFHLQRGIAGSWTTIANVPGNSFLEDTDQLLEIEFDSPTIRVTFAGTLLADVEDAMYTQGQIGYWVRGMQGITFDNLYITDDLLLDGDAFADAVVFNGVQPGNVGNANMDPGQTLGAPDGEFTSLGGACAANPDSSIVVLDMGPDAESITDGPGMDFEVLEIGQFNGGVAEPFEVYLSNQATGPWTYIGLGDGDSFFDLAGTGICSARYVRLVDQSTETCNSASQVPGSDIDAVIAFYPGQIDLPTPVLEISIAGGMVHLQWNTLLCASHYRVESAAIPSSGPIAWSLLEITGAGESLQALPADPSDRLYRVIAVAP